MTWSSNVFRSWLDFIGMKTPALIVVTSFLVAVNGCSHETNPEPQQSRKDSIEIFKAAFSSPEDCKTCHPRHYQEWAMSMHAYAIVDPVFHSLNTKGQELTNGALDQFCVNCHAPFVTLFGEAPGGIVPKSGLSAKSAGGVTCDGCHAIESFEPGHAIRSFRLDGVKAGGVTNPVPNSFHRSEFQARFKSSEICAGCHDVVNHRGFRVEETFTEWKNSSYPARELPCQSCHMKYEDNQQIAVGGPSNRRYHSHIMEGVDVPLTDGFPGRERTIELVDYQLKFSHNVSMLFDFSAKRDRVFPMTVEIYNRITGHNVPSGTIFERQMWIELIAIDDRSGDTLCASGLLDPNSDLRNEKSEYVQRGLVQKDTSLALFNGIAYRHGVEVPFFFLADAVKNKTVPPFESRFGYYYIQPEQLRNTSSFTVSVRVLFRAFPPYFLRSLGHADLVAKVPIFTMYEDSRQVTVR